MQVSRVKPIQTDAVLTKEDCIELFRKHNCVPGRFTTQLCQDLNSCIMAPEVKHCLVTLKDEDGDQDQLESIQELLENLGLTLGGTTIGAYFARIIRIRHLFRTVLCAVAMFFMNFLNKIKPNREKGRHHESTM